MRVWDAKTNKRVAELVSHTDRVPALAWSPDGSLLISAGWDTSARVWRLPQSDPVMLLNSHADQVHTLAYSPDGKYLACADSDFDIHLWTDPAGAGRGPVLRGHCDEIRHLAFSAGRNPTGQRRRGSRHPRLGRPRRQAPGRAEPQGRELRRGHRRQPAAAGQLRRPRGPRLGHRHRRRGRADQPLPGPCRRGQPGRAVARRRRHRSLHATVGRGRRRPGRLARGDQAADRVRDVLGRLEVPRPHQPGRWSRLDLELRDQESRPDPDRGGGRLHARGRVVPPGRPSNRRGRHRLPLHRRARRGGVRLGHPDARRSSTRSTSACTRWRSTRPGSTWPAPGWTTRSTSGTPTRRTPSSSSAATSSRSTASRSTRAGATSSRSGDDLTVRIWDVLSGRLLVAREFDVPVQSLAFSPDGKYLFCGNANTTCYQIEFKKLLED